jgi:hypothetical protein
VLSFGVDDHEHCRFCGIVLLPPSLHRVRSDNVTSYVSVSAIAEFVKQPVKRQSVGGFRIRGCIPVELKRV